MLAHPVVGRCREYLDRGADPLEAGVAGPVFSYLRHEIGREGIACGRPVGGAGEAEAKARTLPVRVTVVPEPLTLRDGAGIPPAEQLVPCGRARLRPGCQTVTVPSPS